MTLSFLFPAISYVVSAPYFWVSMGTITAASMFVGATLYNGDLGRLAKGLVTIFSYAFFILLTNESRIWGYCLEHPCNTTFTFASTVNIFFVTLFYTLGIILGVLSVHRVHKRG